jgi:hypothetical protein
MLVSDKCNLIFKGLNKAGGQHGRSILLAFPFQSELRSEDRRIVTSIRIILMDVTI